MLPEIGNKAMVDVNRGDFQRLYVETAEKSESVAKHVKSIMNISFNFAVEKKFLSVNPAIGLTLPRAKEKKQEYHARKIDPAHTLSLEQINVLIDASKGTKIHLMVLFNVLMGLRCSEIIALKY